MKTHTLCLLASAALAACASPSRDNAGSAQVAQAATMPLSDLSLVKAAAARA